MIMKTKIVVFSSRKCGNCEHIAQYIKENLIHNCDIFYFSEHSIVPCGQCRYECFDSFCPHANDGEVGLLENICRSDKTIFVLPNYCDYPCANFFIFNERSNGFFQGQAERLEQYLRVPKKFIVVSGSQSEHFMEAFWQHSDREPEILFLSAKACGTTSIGTVLMQSELAQNLVKEFIIR